MSGGKLGERQPRKGAMEAIRKHIGPSSGRGDRGRNDGLAVPDLVDLSLDYARERNLSKIVIGRGRATTVALVGPRSCVV